MRVAAERGTLEARSSPTLAAFVENAFRPLYLPRYRAATRVRYEGVLRQGLLDELGSRNIDEIGPTELRRFAAWLTAEGIGAKGPTNLLRTVLRAAVELGELEALPIWPKLYQDGRKLPDAPSDEEVTAALGHARGWLRSAIALAAFGGLRLGEVRALEVRDVDMTNGNIVVRHALSEDERVSPKSGHERVVPIALAMLGETLREAMRHKLPAARVVVNNFGRTPGRQHVLSSLKSLQRRHGLKERSFHSLRHYFVSTLVRRGASVEAVRVLAGHSSLAVTARYTHATRGDLASAIATLSRPGN
jgi:integrase